MKQIRWTSLFSLLLVFAFSTACLTLFPRSPEPPPTQNWNEPERGPLKFDPPELPAAKAGVPYEVEIKVTQNMTPVGDFIVDPDTLPPGLELVIVKEGKDTARITGTPEKAGTYTFRVDVWCYGTMVNGQTGSQEYTIEVE
ncbi:MAG TPA: Ig domain-containing protein [Anaerolineales bacterium]|nr:Ig domain-containing protein [Anaerolineales bacterium]